MNKTLEITLIETSVTLETKPTNITHEIDEYHTILSNLPQNLNGSNPSGRDYDSRDPQTVEAMIKDVLTWEEHHIIEENYSDILPNNGKVFGIPDYKELEKVIPYDPNWPSGLAGGDRRLIFLDSLYKDGKVKLFSLGQALTLFNCLLETSFFKKSSGQHFIVFLKSSKFCYVSVYRSRSNNGRYKFAYMPNPYGLLSFGRDGHMIIT